MKCKRCGLESGLEEAFIKRRRLFHRSPDTICPNCELEKGIRGALTAYVFIPLTAVVLSILHPTLSWTWHFVVIAGMMAVSIPLAVLHELSHAFAANLLGMTVFSITLGIGRELFTLEKFGVNWDVRLIPLGGTTRIAGPPLSRFRLRLWLIYLAGPALHLILALIAWRGWLTVNLLGGSRSLLGYVLVILFYSNLGLLVVNLLPLQSLNAFGVTSSDGWNLIRLPVMARDEAMRMADRQYANAAVVAARRKQFDEAKELMQKGLDLRPDDPHIANGSGFVNLTTGDLPGARAEFVRALDALGDEEPGFRYLLLNNLAYLDALLEDPERMDEADRHSQEAYENGPWVPALMGTRGAVLSWLGRHDEGIPLLKNAMARADGPDSKAEDAYLLALAEARRGDLTQASEYLSLGKELDPQSYLLDIVADRVSEASRMPPPASVPTAIVLSNLMDYSPGRRPPWWTSIENLARLSLAWGFWNLIALEEVSIAPGISFLLLGGVGIVYQRPAMMVAWAIAAAWTGGHSFLRGTAPAFALGAVHFLLTIAVLLGHRKRQGWEAARRVRGSRGLEADGSTSDGQVGPLLAALFGVSSLAVLVGLIALVVYSLLFPFVAVDPVEAAARFEAEYQGLLYFFYLLEPLAVAGLALGIASLRSGEDRRWLSYLGVVSGGLMMAIIISINLLAPLLE
jgi:tetratricopeptide (TPR) repeat protein